MSGITEFAVYDVRQSDIVSGAYRKEYFRVENVLKVSVEYAAKINSRFEATGQYFEINEKLNDEYQELLISNQNKIEAEKVEELKVINDESKGDITNVSPEDATPWFKQLFNK